MNTYQYLFVVKQGTEKIVKSQGGKRKKNHVGIYRPGKEMSILELPRKKDYCLDNQGSRHHSVSRFCEKKSRTTTRVPKPRLKPQV